MAWRGRRRCVASAARRLVLGSELLEPLENVGALHVELAEAGRAGGRARPRGPRLRAARPDPAAEPPLDSSGASGGGGSRTSAASSSAIWRWSSLRVAAPPADAAPRRRCRGPARCARAPRTRAGHRPRAPCSRSRPRRRRARGRWGAGRRCRACRPATAARIRSASWAPSGSPAARSTLRSSSGGMRGHPTALCGCDSTGMPADRLSCRSASTVIAHLAEWSEPPPTGCSCRPRTCWSRSAT